MSTAVRASSRPPRSAAMTSFRIRELFPLGQGGMGTTFLACVSATAQFERLVVVKRLHEHLVHDEEARQRLLEEAELAGCVQHANVVGVQHLGADTRGLFLVIDYVDGASLRKLLQKTAPAKIPVPIALRIVLDALAGLEAIHTATDHRGTRLDILHRDVTPENILIGVDGVARVADFGIAKSSRSAVRTSPLQLVGKLPFMAPEYIDHARLGPSLDVYAMGVTFFRLLAGRSPWESLEEAQLLVRILTEGVPPLPDELDVHPELRVIVAKACAKDPTDRYQSAGEMRLALERLRREVSIAEQIEVAEFVRRAVADETPSPRERAAALLGPRPPSSPEFERDTSTSIARFRPSLAPPPSEPPGFTRDPASSSGSEGPGTTPSFDAKKFTPWVALATFLTIAFTGIDLRGPAPAASPVRVRAQPAITDPVSRPTEASPSPTSAPADAVDPTTSNPLEPTLHATSPAEFDTTEPADPSTTKKPVRRRANEAASKERSVSSSEVPPSSSTATGSSTSTPSEIVKRNPYR